MSWRVWATSVRSDGCGLRWELECRRGDVAKIVTADTSREGRVWDLQSGEHVGWSGDERLDLAVAERLRQLVAQRHVFQQLDRIERPRGRSDRLRRAA